MSGGIIVSGVATCPVDGLTVRSTASSWLFCFAVRSPSARSASRAGKQTCAACWRASCSMLDDGASWQTSLTHICRQSARSI